ncbi:hypothetical protein HKD37_07G018966 [Glycine soja]
MEVFATRDDVFNWAHSVVYDIGFVAVIMRSDTNIGNRGRISYVLIGYERSGKYRAYKKDLVQTVTASKKCGCLSKLQVKPVLGVGHPYVDQLTKDDKTIIGDMTKSMVKPKNILLTLKEHNGTSCTTMKQVYNARYERHL